MRALAYQFMITLCISMYITTSIYLVNIIVLYYFPLLIYGYKFLDLSNYSVHHPGKELTITKKNINEKSRPMIFHK